MNHSTPEAYMEEVPLTGLLAEFRTALQEEIAASIRNEASAAIPLVNGHRVAQIGGSYQYVFEVETALNLPGDAPGMLHIPNFAPKEVAVVSIEGMNVTLSISMDMGKFIPIAKLQSNLTLLMRKLIERIEKKASIICPISERILNCSPANGCPIPNTEICLVNKGKKKEEQLNKQQLDALASSLGRDITFIWGPPGTGKTKTIGAIGVQLFSRERSFLLVSHTNAAVDEALLRIADVVDISELEKGRILRVGVPKNEQLLNESGKYREVLLKTHTDRRSAELSNKLERYKEERAKAIIEVKKISRLVDLCEWVVEATQDIEVMNTQLNSLQSMEVSLGQARERQKMFLSHSAQWTMAKDAAANANNAKLRNAELDQLISNSEIELSSAETREKVAGKELSDAEAILKEILSVGWLTRKWRGLPSPEIQQTEVARLKSAHVNHQKIVFAKKTVLTKLQTEQSKFKDEIDAFRMRYSTEPETVLQKVNEHFSELKSLKLRIDQLLFASASSRNKLENTLSNRLSVLREWNLSSECTSNAEEMLFSIRQSYHKAKTEISGEVPSKLKDVLDQTNNRILFLDIEIQKIEESLKKIEEIIISEAVVVATTLTRAYLRDSIQNRRFDTVILDEASMAPIPALWVAASIAIKSAVVVGDFKQLPPIVISERVLPRKWLGSDIFMMTSLVGPYDNTKRRIDLLKQHRMHPMISQISNYLIYDEKLKDADGMHSAGEDKLNEWYRKDWGHDHPVLLVDTSSLGAWVTSVSRGARASRLNFLSATLCVDLAEKILKSDREKLINRDKRRILIVCPYRPHAKLLELLIHEQGLDKDVIAGTAHTFQGSEADVVIFDLVNDEPHWRVGMFMQKNDDTVKRLVNVAITRAKRRLIVVGDFNYIEKKSRHAFMGKEFIPFLRKQYPIVDARDIAPEGLAAKAAKAQRTILGGIIEPHSDRVIVTQDHFYKLLMYDLASSRNRVVIYSAFITQDRLGQLEPQIKAAIERNVKMYIVTKAISDRNKKELANYRILENTLKTWGVTVVHKEKMHEKLVFIDDEVIWAGSLNPLSFSNTQEIMERRHNKKVALDYAKTVLLDDLVGEYCNGSPACPICGDEIIAREGKGEPFYWTCIQEGCYSRNVNQPPLTNGIITCAKCGGPVEYGLWGKRPIWKCTINPKHRQFLLQSHLRLPKMRTLVPSQILNKLEEDFGETHSIKKSRNNPEQLTLFDIDKQ